MTFTNVLVVVGALLLFPVAAMLFYRWLFFVVGLIERIWPLR